MCKFIGMVRVTDKDSATEEVITQEIEAADEEAAKVVVRAWADEIHDFLPHAKLAVKVEAV